MDKIKNPIFLENCLDPTNNKYVKQIYIKKISKKSGNTIWWIEWLYYKNRGNYSVRDVYKHYHGKEAQIIYMNDSVIHNIILDKTLRPIVNTNPEINNNNLNSETENKQITT